MPQLPADDALDSLAYTLRRYREIKPSLAFPGGDAEAIGRWREKARTRLRERIGLAPAAPKVPDLDPQYGPIARRDGYARQSVTFRTRDDLSAFGYLLLPDGGPARKAGVVCLPGHGRGVDDIVGIDEKGKDRDDLDGYQHDFAVQCARHGYATLALEMLGFGHRRDPAARKAGPEQSSCQPAAGAALLLGECMVGWRTWDTMRALDLLASRPEVDPGRLALMGISGGGTVSLYAAAIDERVKVAVLSCSFCTLRDSIFGLSHCIDNYVPGLLRDFETADLAGLVAPRFLFCEAGLTDPIFPESGVREALASAARIYEASGAPDHLDHAFFDAGHQFDGRKAFERLGGWLGPS